MLIRSLLLALVASILLATADAAQALTRQALAPSDGDCAVQNVKHLAEGGDQSWSHVHELLAYDQMDASGLSQLRTIRPDGSGDRCLTCGAGQSGGPRTDRHKFNPVWHPAGKFLVLQGEMDTHPLSWYRESWTSELYANGLWSNLYATTPDGQRWYRLTDYGNSREDGALAPYFSPDSKTLLWSRMLEKATESNPFGRWRLQLGDFVVSETGVPSLQNIRDITPAGAKFVEPHGFSPDGSTIIFTSDIENSHAWGMDVWVMKLASGARTNLTRSGYWDEHASFSPGGGLISYMSSEPYPWETFKTELFLMKADGTGKRRLTDFNLTTYPNELAEKNMPTRNSWSADGTRLAITLQYGGESYPRRQLYMLTFVGACGG